MKAEDGGDRAFDVRRDLIVASANEGLAVRGVLGVVEFGVEQFGCDDSGGGHNEVGDTALGVGDAGLLEPVGDGSHVGYRRGGDRVDLAL